MKRNVFSLFCAAAIATQCFTPKAVTAEDNTFDCFTYEIQSDHVKLCAMISIQDSDSCSQCPARRGSSPAECG